MPSDRDIIESVRKMSGVFNRDVIGWDFASVDSVDEAARTCNVTTISGKQSTAIENVRLMATVDDGILLIPSVGSTLIVAHSRYNVSFVSLFSSLDKVLFIVGSTVLQIEAGKLTFNDGSFGGLVQVADLVTKLNKLESDLNSIKNVFYSWAPVPNDGGAALKAASAAWAGQAITETQRTDIENTTIAHGK